MKKLLLKGFLLFTFFIIVLGALTDGGKKLEGENSTPTASTSPTIEPTSTPTELTLEQRLEKAIKEELVSSSKIKEVKTIKNQDGSLIVEVNLNASENISSNLTQLGIKKDVSSVFYGLYKSDFQIENVIVTSYYPTTDKYGNKGEAVIYKSTLSKAEAQKVNWSQDKSLLKGTTLPSVWKVEVDNLNQL
jgi:hypothetical protein